MRWARALLVLPLALAAFLRFDSLGLPSLWLDEILGHELTTASASRPWWMWMVGFDPEHGPLYYGTQWVGRIAAQPEAGVRWIPALLGVVAVWLVWLAGRALGSSSAALLAALLLAASPLHVYYSREGRPYALLTFLSAATLVTLLRGSRWFYAALAAALYTSAVAGPLIAGAAVAALASALQQQDTAARRRDLRFAGCSIVALALIPILYRGSTASAPAAPFPALDAAFFDTLVRSFAVTALGSPERGRAAYALLAVAVAGAVALIVRDRRRGVIVLSMAVVPVAAALSALYLTDHWYAVRYLTPALPAYLLLAAAPLLLLDAKRAEGTRLRTHLPWAVALLAGVAMATQTLPAARREPYAKLDWRLIASTIWRHAAPGDTVITAESWSYVSLGFYLRRLPDRVRLFEVGRPEIAEALLAKNRRAWLVSAGKAGHSPVTEWMCRYPVVLSSREEGFRLHYAPDLADLLRTRSTAHERRALLAGDDALALTMEPRDAIFLGEEWADVEGDGETAFRWVVGDRGTVVVPLTGQKTRTIRIRASPLTFRELPPQVMKVALNGRFLQQFVMPGEVEEFEVHAPATLWRADGANVLALGFARANAPADLDRTLTDPRPLSAAVHRIEVDAEGRTPRTRRVRHVRLQPLDERGVPRPLESPRIRTAESRLAPLARDAVIPLLGRLGLDPHVLWRALETGAITLDELLETIATSSACEDERAFIRRTWMTLFQREPNTVEERVLLTLLREENDRSTFIRRVARMDEVRRAVGGSSEAFRDASSGPE